MFGSAAYQILKNASQARFIDYFVYTKYLAIICEVYIFLFRISRNYK